MISSDMKLYDKGHEQEKLSTEVLELPRSNLELTRTESLAIELQTAYGH